jgi:hypothetical protein
MGTTKKTRLVFVTTFLGMIILACSCWPVASLTGTPTATPTGTPGSTPGKTQVNRATFFQDDFSNTTSGWLVLDTTTYLAGYHQKGFYEMGLRQPNDALVSVAPVSFTSPLTDVLLKVRAEPWQANTGDYGMICRYQEGGNFYMAGITGFQFYLGRFVEGRWTYLTDPEWQDLPSYTMDPEGYFTLGLSCTGQSIRLEINGLQAAQVTDDALSDGSAGLVVWSYEEKDEAGFYAHASFDDFSLEVPGQ